MSDVLDQAIEEALDDTTTLPSLLRKVLAVGHRVGSDELKDWVRWELNGYGDEPERLPHYRRNIPVAVVLTFVPNFGPGQLERRVSPGDFPDLDGLRDSLFTEQLAQPIGEITHWADKDKPPSAALGTSTITMMRSWGEEGAAPAMHGAILNEARKELSPASVNSLLDNVRTTALELCLEVQSELPPSAASHDGPRDSDAMTRLPERVNHLTVQYVYGGATGHLHQGQTIDVTVNQGDLDGLLQTARKLGLEDEALADLEQAVTSDGSPQGESTRTFVEKLRDGAYNVAGNVSTRVASEQINSAISGFFG